MSLFIDFMHSLNQSESADNFGKKLFDLVLKADPENLGRLEKGFPAHVALVRWWRVQPVEPAEREIQAKADWLENYCGGGLKGWPR